MELLDGKVAVITGAGGGIGRCHALAFALAGAKVVVNDVGGARDGTGAGESMADAVVAEIRKTGGTAVANYDSVADPAGAERIVRTALDEFGRLDILVNNAGILRDKTLVKMEDDMWRAVIAVHLDGTFYCGRAAARYMKEKGVPGRIINTTSVAGLKGNFGQSNYGAAKAGIVGLTLTWSKELEKYGITVNAIAPLAKTRLTEGIDVVPDELGPETVSPVVVFLASDLASKVNGRIFGVHGTHLFEYKMEMTEGVKKDSAWTPQELAERLDEISAVAAAPPSRPSVQAGSLEERVERAFALSEKAFVAKNAAGWKATIHFLIDGADDWTIAVENGKCDVKTGTHGEPTCKVEVSAETLADMIEGKISGQQAFMSGKIKADNLQDMMKFGKVFDFKRARAAAEPAPKADLGPYFQNLPSVFLADKAGAFAGKIAFDVAGTEGWTVTVENGTCAVAKGRDPQAICTITADAESLSRLFEGKTDFAGAGLKANNAAGLLKMRQLFDWTRAGKPAEGLNRKLIGKKYRGSAVFVRAENIRAYAEATDDPNPKFREGIVAPPVFGVTLIGGVLRQVLADDLGRDLLRMVHGEQRIRYHGLLEPWDLVSPRATIAGIEDKQTGQVLHIDQFVYREGEPVVEMRTALFFRDEGATKASDVAKAPEKPPGQRLFSRTVAVADDQSLRYAEASGDRNPIHTDPEIAKAAGLGGIILQGLCTMAFAGQAVLEEHLGGDPERLAEISVRFRRPVYPGDRLTTEGFRKDAETIAFAVLNQDGVPVITNGLARVR